MRGRRLLLLFSFVFCSLWNIGGSVAFDLAPGFFQSWYKDVVNVIQNYNDNIVEEVKFRQVSFYQYHNQIQLKIKSMIEKFSDHQIQQRILLEKELNDYLLKFQNISILLNQQLQEKQILNKELEILKNKYQRPKIFDKSLEDFQKAFNESSIIQTLFPTFSLPSSYPKVFLSDKKFKKEEYSSSSSTKKPFAIFPRWMAEWWSSELDPFSEQFELLNDQFSTSLNQLKQFSDNNRIKSEKFIKKTIKDLNQYKESILLQSKTLEKATLEIIPKALTKEEIRKTRDLIEKNLDKLEKDGLLWFEQKKNELDTTLKLLQEKLTINENMYEELLGKKKSSIHYTIMNDITLKKVLTMIDSRDSGKRFRKKLF